MTTPRCTQKGCPTRWRSGADRACHRFDDDTAYLLTGRMSQLGIDDQGEETSGDEIRARMAAVMAARPGERDGSDSDGDARQATGGHQATSGGPAVDRHGVP